MCWLRLSREAQRLLGEAEHITRQREENIRKDRTAVLLEIIEIIMRQAVAVQADLTKRRVALRALTDGLNWADPSLKAVKGFLLQSDLPAGMGGVDYSDWDSHPALLPWKRFLSDLLADPNAEVPE